MLIHFYSNLSFLCQYHIIYNILDIIKNNININV